MSYLSKLPIDKLKIDKSFVDDVTVNEESDGSWESKVFVVEKLGSGTFLYLEKEGEPLVVQTEGDSKIKVGDTVKVGFSSSRCHIFDSSNNAFK